MRKYNIFLWGLIGGAFFMTMATIWFLYSPYFLYPKDVSNIKWVYDENISPTILIVPGEVFDKLPFENGKTRDEFTSCMAGFNIKYDGYYIIIREGHEDCMEHEFGHIRESEEGIESHTSIYTK